MRVIVPALLSLLIACALFGQAPPPAVPTAAPAIESSSAAADVSVPGGVLRGTLLMPKVTAAKIPVVLIISGSGPTDRNGNSALITGKNNSLQLLAEGLAANGIASMRYDKRGIADSAKAAASESELRFDMYVDDAVAWCNQLRDDERFSGVVIAGHSEGSLIGMLAAKRCRAAGFVSLAGAGRRASDLLRAQLAGKLPEDVAKQNEDMLKKLETGETSAMIPQGLAMLYRPSVQPYLISWFKHDPSKAIAALSVPVLIVQGTTDIQVAMDEAKRLAAASPKAKLAMIEGMNHVLKAVPADQQKQLASYGDPTLGLAPGLIPAVVDLVRSAVKK